MKRQIKKVSSVVLIVVYVLFQALPAFAMGMAENRATLVLIPGLSWNSISPERTPNLFQMMESGGAANMTLPFRGDDDSGYRAVISGGKRFADPSSLIDIVKESGGRVETIGKGLDYSRLYHEYKRLQDRNNLLIVEAEPLMELAAKRKTLAPEDFSKLYEQQLAEVDRFIGKLLSDTDLNHLLIVVSPDSFGETVGNGKSVGVVLMDGAGVERNSLLASNTTRQEGLVTVYDIAPTILSHLGLPTYIKGGLGDVIGSIPAGIPSYQFLREQIGNLTLLNELRPYLAKGYAVVMLGILVIMTLLCLMRLRNPHWLQNILVGFLMLPAVYLLYPVLEISSPRDMIIKLAGFGALGWICLAFARTFLTRLLAISSVTLGLILFDMVRQGQWMKHSPLGFDLLGGARYYGIGNEYMGVLIGASVLMYVLLRKRYSLYSKRAKIIGGIGFSVITYLLASPRFGTNAGGALAAAITYGYLLASGENGPSARKKWAWVFGGTLAVLCGMLILNITVPADDQTHIGRAVSLLMHGEYAELTDLLARKWALNWWLLEVSVWGKLFLVLVAVLILHFFRPGLFHPIPEGREASLLTSGSLVGGGAAFLLNDSGVLAAAGLMLFAAVAILTQAIADETVPADASVQDESLVVESGTHGE